MNNKNKYFCQIIHRAIIDDFESQGFVNDDSNIWDITGIRPINILIGANSSGKSRLLRKMFKSEFSLIDSDIYSQDRLFERVISLLITKVHEGRRARIKAELQKQFCQVRREFNPVNIVEQCAKAIHNAQLYNSFYHKNLTINRFVEKTLEPLLKDEDFFTVLDSGKTTAKHLYIPLLRGLRPLHSDDKYHDRTVKDYFENKAISNSREIFTGHTLYSRLQSALLGTYEERRKVREFEQYLSNTFFKGQPLSLVPRVNSDVVYFKEGDKEERPIYDLGDGIQSILVLTFPVFMATASTTFYIEEPEQHLHASMQRILIDAFASHPEHLYFMTTHSNHFIDIAQERDNISLQRVYHKSEGSDEKSHILPLSSYSDALADLGVRASSVLLANCSIWVEGLTDKLYLRAYMNKYIEEISDSAPSRSKVLQNYQENFHFVFTEYQGSNITHWSFSEDDSEIDTNKTHARALNKDILLIADQDIDKKGNRVEKLKEALGDKFHLLNLKEIENYIPIDVIKEAAKKRWDNFNQTDGSTLNLSNLQQKTYATKGKGIGKKLENCIEKKDGLQRNFFNDTSNNSETIKDKVKFCHTAIEVMNNPDFEWTLTTELKELCEKLWSHIEECNEL